MKRQRITIHIDSDLLRRARRQTGQGVSAAIRRGLELVAAARAYDQLRELRGEVPFSIDLKKLREDRS